MFDEGPCFVFRVSGSGWGFRFQVSGFGPQFSNSRASICGLGFRVSDVLGPRVWGLGFRGFGPWVSGFQVLGSRVSGLGFQGFGSWAPGF